MNERAYHPIGYFQEVASKIDQGKDQDFSTKDKD